MTCICGSLAFGVVSVGLVQFGANLSTNVNLPLWRNVFFLQYAYIATIFYSQMGAADTTDSGPHLKKNVLLAYTDIAAAGR